jgi:hypothetical protein
MVEVADLLDSRLTKIGGVGECHRSKLVVAVTGNDRSYGVYCPWSLAVENYCPCSLVTGRFSFFHFLTS